LFLFVLLRRCFLASDLLVYLYLSKGP